MSWTKMCEVTMCAAPQNFSADILIQLLSWDLEGSYRAFVLEFAEKKKKKDINVVTCTSGKTLSKLILDQGKKD